MSRGRSVALAASSAILFATTAACTLVSGVEDYEIRRVVPAPSSTSPTDPAPAASSKEAGAPVAPPTGAKSGPQLCGAKGTWMACEPPALLGTCADSCKSKGLTCVDDCCLEDSLGKYPAKIGMAFSMPELLCSVDAVITNTTGGLCNDPTGIATAAGMQTRCCCK
jgi:hypothetical protein